MHLIKSKISTSKIFSPQTFILVCSLMLGIITFFYCPVSDDLGYSGTYSGYMFRGEPFPGLQPWYKFFEIHATYINGRLGDKFIAVYMAAPKWLMGLLQVICAYLIFLYSAKLAFGNQWNKSNKTIILAALIVFLLPWYDCAFMACMFLNYQCTLALVLPWVWYLLYPPRTNLFVIIALSILSFCVGAWHEGFSIIVLPAIILIQLLRKDNKKNSWYMVLFYILGVCFILSCPAFWSRFQFDYNPHSESIFLFLAKSGITLPFLVAVSVLAIMKSVFKRNLKYSKKDWLLLGLAFELICGTIYLNTKITEETYRLWWFADTFALIGYGLLLRHVVVKRLWRLIITIGFVVVVIIHLIVCIYYQYHIHREYTQVIEQFKKSETGVVYHDVQSVNNISLFTLRKPQRDVFMHYLLKKTAWIHPDLCVLRLLPTELKSIDTLTLDTLNTEQGIYKTPQGNLLVSMAGIKDVAYGVVWERKDDGREVSTLVVINALDAHRDTTLCYMRVHNHIWESNQESIKPIKVDIWE